MSSKYAKTYEIFDPLLATMVGESHTHEIYLCPFCITKRGKPDKEGKFYWKNDNSIGMCFKCHTVGFPEEGEEVDKEASIFNQVISRAITRLKPVSSIYPEPAQLNVDFPSFPELSQSNIEYLKNRNPLIIPLLPLLGCRSWTGSRDGVVFPFSYKKYIAKFQVRFDTDNKKFRYYTSPGDKVLYSPLPIFKTFNLGETKYITLCEGVFDSIALLILGFPNPIAVLGSTLTDIQIGMLRSLLPDHAMLCMDNYDLNKSIRDQIVESVPSLSGTSIPDLGSGDMDPEEFLLSCLDDQELKSHFIKNIFNVLGTYMK